MPDGRIFRWLRRHLHRVICGSCLMTLAHPVAAGFSIPGYELVYNAPAETPLQVDDLRTGEVVWREMFAGARERIDITQFYVAGQSGSRLETVLAALREAAARGVKIRVLLEDKGLCISTPETLAAFQAIPGLEMRIIPFGKLAGGIIHAKYLVVDGSTAFVGSQNFDWRALEHIQETGLRITDASVVQQIAAVFEQDWQAQPRLVTGQPVPMVAQPAPVGDLLHGNYLVASPRDWNPPGVRDTQAVLPRLLDSATQRIRVQVMEYAPLSYGPDKSRPFYPLIDNALRRAAARGVKVELMVADWNTGMPAVAWLKSLALVPNVQVKIVTIPPASGGFIPYARVVHSKIMTIDGRLGWVGTSNWSGGYFDNSRNLELVMNSEAMAARLDGLYQQLWDSPFAAPLRIGYDYPRPNPGGEKGP